jgi:hypothetical protein
MLASFTIQVHDPVESVAIPARGVTRNRDGTFAACVTVDRHRLPKESSELACKETDNIKFSKVCNAENRPSQMVPYSSATVSTLRQAIQ